MTKSTSEQLIATYQKLSPLQKSIAQILSIAYDKLSRTSIINCLNKLDIRNPNGGGFAPKTINQFIETAKPVIFITESETKYPVVYCNELFIEIVTREAVRENTFDTIVTVIEKEIYFPKNDWIREIRINFYRQDIKPIPKQVREYYRKLEYGTIKKHPYVQICCNPFDGTWLNSLPEELLIDIVVTVMDDSKYQLKSQPEFLAFLEIQSTFTNHIGRAVDITS